jgi:hypothetical protein
MSPAEPEQTAAPFQYKDRKVLRGKNAPTLFRHGRARSISVSKEWTSVLVFHVTEEIMDREARIAEEERLRLRREKRALVKAEAQVLNKQKKKEKKNRK